MGRYDNPSHREQSNPSGTVTYGGIESFGLHLRDAYHPGYSMTISLNEAKKLVALLKEVCLDNAKWYYGLYKYNDVEWNVFLTPEEMIVVKTYLKI